jgi:hypothetical protein
VAGRRFRETGQRQEREGRRQSGCRHRSPCSWHPVRIGRYSGTRQRSGCNVPRWPFRQRTYEAPDRGFRRDGTRDRQGRSSSRMTANLAPRRTLVRPGASRSLRMCGASSLRLPQSCFPAWRLHLFRELDAARIARILCIDGRGTIQRGAPDTAGPRGRELPSPGCRAAARMSPARASPNVS